MSGAQCGVCLQEGKEMQWSGSGGGLGVLWKV